MASTIKVDNVQNQPGTNIVSKCGTDVTLGASGDTVALASGASQTGFGRAGSVDWQTGSIKTAGFTPTNGEGYFCDTSGGAFAVTLPAGSAGNIVAFADYTRTFTSNNLTITPNGSEKIGGVNDDALLTVDGQSAAFVYVDSTEGWINVQETQTSVLGETPTYITASGGTPLTVGDYKTHIFTGPGCFQVTCKGNAAGSQTLEYFIVGAGGGGGTVRGAGGGGGGFRMYSTAPGCNSPLNAPGGITAAVQTYPIVRGGGGAGNGPYGPPTQPSTQASAGSVSSGIGLTSAGGGFGGNNTPCCQVDGGDGGSGGGGGGQSGGVGGSGNVPLVSPAQGKDGGDDVRNPSGEAGAGGGGAGACGGDSLGGTSGGGGAGSYIADPFIGPTAPSYGTPGPVGSTRYFAGGGGASSSICSPGAGGVGGGAAGGSLPSRDGGAGTINTGGGGGGGAPQPTTGGTGGSGIVMIRYKYQ